MDRKRRYTSVLYIFLIIWLPSTFATHPGIGGDRDSIRSMRVKMVREQIEGRGIKDERVLLAMTRVPRHLFVPPSLAGKAYSDHPLPIGEGQTISQPYIVALMTELLEVKRGDKILEVGTGSGYQATILAEMGADVVTMEIFESLAESAAKRLSGMKYDGVTVIQGDGYFGHGEKSPFDGIIVTCAAPHVPNPLLSQLKVGGRMVIPVGAPFMTQNLIIVRKKKGGKITAESVLPVMFVPLLGH